jgi:hypothetical protein
MKATLQSLVSRIRWSSRTQAGGLTIIGIAMLISTIVAEALEQPALREGAQIAIILIGALATALLFSPSIKDQHTDERNEDVE